MTARRKKSAVDGGSRPRRTIRVTGVLDMSEARRLAEALSLSSDGAELRVDLRSARETHDAAVVALARALGLHNGSILGLSRHHERLLGYVGQLTGEPGP